MKKRILNILVIFFIVFISIFANKKVEADTNECTYAAPMTFIDPSITSGSPVRNVEIIMPDRFKVTDRTIFEVNARCETEKSGIVCRTYYMSSKATAKVGDNFGVIPDLFKSSELWKEDWQDNLRNVDCSKKYMIITAYQDNSGSRIKYETKDNIQSQYINSLKSQYKGNKKTYEYLAPITAPNDDTPQIWSYINTHGPIVLINTAKNEKYTGTTYNKFVEYGKQEVSKGTITQETLDKYLNEFPIEQGYYNERSYSKDYYTATKIAWATYYNQYKDVDSGSSTTVTPHQLMANWFYFSGRYILDENVATFKKYFMYIFNGFFDEKQYNWYLDAIDAIEDFKKAADKEDCFDNLCNVYCTTQSKNGTGVSCDGTAWNECTKYDTVSKKYTGNQDYGRCQTAYKECESEAEKDCSRYPTNSPAYEKCIGDKSSKQSRIDSCLQEKLGVEEYNRMKEKEKTQKEAIEQEKEDAFNKFIYSLSSISAPSLDINFDNHYELTCDDVSFFHGFYVVLRVVAPIAVIFFGTLDYAKAVIASDVEKMNKSKKNFPKRLLLLLLFIAIPLIISLLLDLFDTDYNLMRCIIKGE